MQGIRSRPGSSEMTQKSSSSSSNPKRSPSPKITRGSSFSSDPIDSRVSRASDRKPSPMSHSLQEKQRTMRVPEMQQQLGKVLADMKRAKEERSQALEELAELKKKNEGFAQSADRIMKLELEVEKAKESEMKLLESLISQTKELEQTKILLEEAKLEVRNLMESAGPPEKKGLLASVQAFQAQEEVRMLRNELRLALEAEEKSKKAMDDFAIALKEVTTEATLAKEELDVRISELEILRAESEHTKSLFQSSEQKRQEAVEGYNELKLEYQEASIAWKVKEDSFRNCVMISEEGMEKKDEENSKLVEAHRAAKEENSKLRDIIKQAVNEAMVVKESLALVRNENHELKELLSEKESALEKMKQEYESLKVSETAALASVKEMKNRLASSSGTESIMASSNLLEIEPFGQSNGTSEDRKITKNGKKFSSDRWDNPRIQNGGRRSVGESGIAQYSAFDKRGAFERHDKRSSSDGFDHLDGILFHESKNEKLQKKKKTVFGRFGDALRRRSFRKA
ncbi:interactor of constitutive active ROPs 5-like isoform X2 [Phalaenopsis equestris]|uniref:interactor of constitutive active ROPs 5-like isoform X2 n=1 Tax=Phalaenopsis equestris TaxID=78828 RepID=UPI0009E32D52|nr:interactor of constitutive active ROPs 5-like isoform X2 [Phalaenopsis equestris]